MGAVVTSLTIVAGIRAEDFTPEQKLETAAFCATLEIDVVRLACFDRAFEPQFERTLDQDLPFGGEDGTDELEIAPGDDSVEDGTWQLQ